MKPINENDELKLAIQMETEATLESASSTFEVAASKEKLNKAVVQETAAIDVSTDSALELAGARDKLAKQLKNEGEGIDLEADSSVELAAAKEKLAKKLNETKEQAQDESKVNEELEKVRKRRVELEEELVKQLPMVDYSEHLKELNAKVAEALKEKFDELKKTTQSEGSVRAVNDKYTKQAEKELASRQGIFKRVNKSLTKTAKTSESGLARMSSKMVLGASNMISDKINDFVDGIPVLGQANKVRRFVKENRSKADDVKHKRLVRERASELRAAGRAAEGGADPGKERKRRKRNDDQRNNERENEKQTGVLEKILDVLGAIRQTQLLSSIINMFSSLSKTMLSGIGTAVATAFGKSGITKILGKLAAALGAAKLGEKLMDTGKPKGPTPTGPDPKKGGPKPGPAGGTPIPDAEGGPKNKPPSTKSPTPPDPKGKGGFIRAVGKALPWVARGALRMMGPVGIAYTAYEVASMAGLTGPIDDMVGDIWDNLKGQTSAVVENQVDPTGDKELQPTKKEGDAEKLTILVTPGKEQQAVNDYVSKMQQCQSDGTSFKDCKNQIKGTAQPTGPKPGDEIERLSEQTRKNEVERERRKEQREAQVAASVSQSSSGSNLMNVNSTNVTNNSNISFNGNEYQTSHQKGSQVVR